MFANLNFLFKEVNNTAPWTYVIVDLHSDETAEIFYEQELKKRSRAKFWIVKGPKKKVLNYILNEKVITICFIVGFINHIKNWNTWFKIGFR